ncbi:hypothetical protein [Sphingomicrobium marinum]|uniref:hypothetical protein n=1 Tax=Sphingomicrobium marinum TaxID=1227950 RepID=UPI0022405399|nr:hypothetical protein [Sphingomicrobium marinum]
MDSVATDRWPSLRTVSKQQKGLPISGGPFFVGVAESLQKRFRKKSAISAIRAVGNSAPISKTAKKQEKINFSQLCAVKPVYFRFMKISALRHAAGSTY